MNKQQLKQAARETVAAATVTIGDVMSWVAGERSKVEQRLGRYEVQAAIALSLGSDAKETLATKETWTEWGLKQFPGMSKTTLYRWRNAGHVARVLQGDGTEAEPDLLGSPPVALVGSLVPLYRVLDLKARSDEARATGRRLARETYAGLLKQAEDITITSRPDPETGETETLTVKAAPLFAAVHAAAEAVAPTNRSGGSKADDSEAEETEAEEKAETEETETEESRRETAGHLVTVDAAAVERAAVAVGPIVAGLVRDTGATEETVRAIMLAALRLAAEHGVDPVRVLLTGKVPSPEAEAEQAETEAAAAAVEAEAVKAEA